MKFFFILGFASFFSFSSLAQFPSFHTSIYDSTAVRGYFFLVSYTGHLLILDQKGEIVYVKSLDSNDSDFKIEPNGLMTYFYDGQFRLMDSTFTVVDSIACKDCETDWHEIKILPNGNTMILGRETVTMDLSKYRIRGRQGSDTAKVSAGLIQEFDQRRQVVFDWRAKDHFLFDDVDTARDIFASPLINWTHLNSFDIDRDGNILLSSRFFKEITKINRRNGSIMWRMGGKHNQFTWIDPQSGAEPTPVSFNLQRNIRVLPNGNISFLELSKKGTRGVEINLDEKKKTATEVWRCIYDSTLVSGLGGSVQRLKNSNTLLDFGFFTNQSEHLAFVMVDSLCRPLFRVSGSRAFRTYYYDSLPFLLPRPQMVCFDSLGIKYLKTQQPYDSYLWNDSISSPVVEVTHPGNYQVLVPCGENGFIYSEKWVVADLSVPCPIEKKPPLQKNK
ncbi:MAG: aryl-sulfate sulfotransferase [Bacteroidetes bacterium]|nr:aryl-sulfate sulfotransferase [Bacteroidota bacterium]